MRRRRMDSKKILSVVAILCIALVPLAVIVWSVNIYSTPDTKLFIDPPLLNFDNLIPGKRFSVNVTVANVTDLKSYELKLSYNTVMLDVVGVTFLPDVNLPVGNFAVNDPAGILTMSCTYDGSSITTTAPVALAKITFKMMARGTSPLHLYDTDLKDSHGNSIPHVTEDGLVLILRHDVAILEVTPSTYETYIGHNVTVTIVASNLGDAPENFTVSGYHDSTVFQTFNVVNLAPATNITLHFSWNTSDVAKGYSYTIKAEASVVPHEADTTNNVKIDGSVKVKIIGDVNNDNVVDLNDLIAWDAAYGSVPGSLNWNPQADINEDGIVNGADGTLIVAHYHETP
jgi:hypothetical protein